MTAELVIRLRTESRSSGRVMVSCNRAMIVTSSGKEDHSNAGYKTSHSSVDETMKPQHSNRKS